MTNWEKYWATHPKTVGRTEYLKQVGRTVKGQPISDLQFQLIVSHICYHLDLQEDDVLLDLGCGNGLITKELAKECKEVVGLDFSQPLLEVANQHHRPGNVIYRHMNILDLDKISQVAEDPFNKVLMYGVLHNLRKRDLITVLRTILPLCSEGRLILIGNVPDRRRKWKFYNTPKRRLAHLVRQVSGRETIGTWWDKELVRKVCKQLSLQCEFHEQSKELHTSHYRFDVTIF